MVNKFINGFRKVTQFLCVTAVLSLTGIFSMSVFVAEPPAAPSGAALGIWGVVNLLEGYGNDNPGANGQSS